MKSHQIFRTLRSSRDLLKNDVLGSYFKNRVPYPPLISQKTENSGSPTTKKTLEKQWILPILGKICARSGQDPFKAIPPVRDSSIKKKLFENPKNSFWIPGPQNWYKLD